MSSSPQDRAPSEAPPLATREFARWAWRQLTSMRTALFLLLFLAIAAVPGSLYPQRGVDARAVELYLIDHPKLGPVLDALGVFSVYTSPWFSAIYLLLMISLIGCIVPRSGVYWKALRARPPKAPRNLERLPVFASFTTEASVSEVLDAGRSSMGRARIDVVDDGDAGEVRSERGYLREAGNLVFHISVVVVLIGVAAGGLIGYRGSAIVSEGDGFSNVLTQYDEFGSGAFFNSDRLPPFTFTLDNFDARFQLDGPQRGAPRSFEATGSYAAKPGDVPRPFDIKVNHPLEIEGTSVYLVGQGYAPVFKVTDPEGNVAFNDAVPFLPSDGTYTSTGVVKVPDAAPDALGFQGFFLPTAAVGEDGESVSIFPAAANPLVGLLVWRGDLGLDAGRPQSVYVLDKTKMDEVMGDNGKPFRVSLQPGQATDIPGGGSIEFVELRQFVRFQISSAPLVKVPLFGIIAGVLGLILSLTIRPRRTWIRARRDGSRTVVEVAALDRVVRGEATGDVDDLLERLRGALGETEDSA